jgi:hypothetical protein
MGIESYATVAGLAFNLVLLVISLKVRAEISASEITMERKIEAGKSEVRAEIKVVELYMRDNFVRSQLFDQVISLLSTNMQSQFERLQASIDKLDAKLDRQNQHPG